MLLEKANIAKVVHHLKISMKVKSKSIKSILSKKLDKGLTQKKVWNDIIYIKCGGRGVKIVVLLECIWT